MADRSACWKMLRRARRLLVRAILWMTPALALVPSTAAQEIGPLTPASPPAMTDQLAKAQQWMQEGKFPQAEAALRPLIAANAKQPEPRYLLAYTLLRENKAADALHEYTSAAALRSPNASELREVALAYVLLKDYADAERWLDRSLAMNSKDAETWYAMGRLRYTQGRYGDAQTCFEKTIELNPQSVKGENNLGLAYEALNRGDDAMRAYRAAIDLQKNSPSPSEQPLLNLAILLLHRNQTAEAQTLLEGVVEIAPKDPRIHENLGQAYLRQARMPDAVKEFRAAVALAPENPRYHFLLGQAYRRSGDDAQARQEFSRSAALNGAHSTSTEE